jgi:hypothetical protein
MGIMDFERKVFRRFEELEAECESLRRTQEKMDGYQGTMLADIGALKKKIRGVVEEYEKKNLTLHR